MDATEETRLVTLVHEHTPIGVSVVSARRLEYIYANQGLATFLGLTRDEILAADTYELWVRITHPEDFDLERKAFQDIVQGRSASYTLEKRFVRSDGTVRWGLTTTTAIRGADGALDLIVAYTVDIHDSRERDAARRERETQSGHSQRLEALGQLAGGVAHDFNNRLVIILGHAEIMREQMHYGDPLREHLDQVIASGRRSAELTRQLLAFSRRQVLAPKVFDLTATVDQMLKMLGRLLGEKVDLVASLGAEGPVYADPGQVEQILVNLAVNARDAMPSGGRLTLATRDITVTTQRPDLPPGRYVELSVSDTGHGIPADVLPRIFEPFFTTKPAGAGTGLGLSTVMGIARQSGGTVSVRSAPGEGTTFSVLLPQAPTSALVRDERPVLPLAARAADRTVLLCDDDAEVRRLLADVIRLRGFRVVEATSGEHALQCARDTGHIDLVVTDVVMAGIDGPEVVQRLRQLAPGVPALFITGHAEPDALSAALAADRAALLAKPFLPTELVRAIDALLAASA